MKPNAILKKSFLILTLLGMLPLVSFSQTQKQTRQASNFTAVSASGIFQVYITQSDEYSVVVEAEEKHIDNVRTRVRNGVLMLDFESSARNVGKIIARVSAPEFTSLKATGAVTFRSENLLQAPALEVSGTGATQFNLQLDVEQLTTRLTGASQVTYSGQATSHDLAATGASVVRAYELYTENTEVKIDGASNARINASTLLRGSVTGTSSLRYQQAPLSREIRSTGLASIHGPNGTTQAQDDTLRVRIGEREVQVVEGKGPRHWTVERARRRTFKGNWGGFELGINGYMTPNQSLELDPEYDFMDLRYERSIAVNLNMFQQSFSLIGQQFGLVSGLGLGWNNYRFADHAIPVHTPEGIGVLEPNPDYNYRRSKMTLLYLKVPLLLEFQTRGSGYRERFHIAAGITSGLRLRSHTKQVYFPNGKRNKDKSSEDFHIRPFRFDAEARMGFGKVNLFATYSLNSLFRDERGPELYPFTVGVRLVRF